MWRYDAVLPDASGCDLRRCDCSFPPLKGEGANLRHLALQIKHCGRNTGSGAFPCFFEAESSKGVARHWNRTRSEALEGRVRFGCPGAEVGKENPQVPRLYPARDHSRSRRSARPRSRRRSTSYHTQLASVGIRSQRQQSPQTNRLGYCRAVARPIVRSPNDHWTDPGNQCHRHPDGWNIHNSGTVG